MHFAKLTWYLARLAVYRQLGFLRFFSKPGSRIIVPVLLIVLAVLARPVLHDFLRLVWAANNPYTRLEPLAMDVMLLLPLALLIYAYVLASRALAVVLGAFPVAKRPLPPMRRLKPTKVDIQPAVVRVVVPRLRRHHA